MTRYFESADTLAGEVIAAVGPNVVLGLPVGLGKAVHVANALYERAVRDPAISLTIFTALTLEVPRARGELERRFLEPLAARLWKGWPALRYAEDLARERLPANIRVHEFYLRPGAYLANPTAQRDYTSLNYTQVGKELLRLGVNVIAQLVAPDPAGARYSLGSNPEVTLDLLPELERRRAAGRPFAFVAEVNPEMPYMPGAAELDAARFDCVLRSEACAYPLFGLPRRAVGDRDYATAMHVASLVRDGGTLQLGIGSLSEALAHCLILRHREPHVFRRVLERLPGGPASGRRPALPLATAPFSEGLYSCTELLSDAVFALYDAGIVRRPADEQDPTVIHAGFFVGSTALYRGLRELPAARRRLIAMSPISFVNSLHGDEAMKRRQRRRGCFVNEAMMVTLLGAAVSDALDDGRVVSGVGGQFDFVRMAHGLDDAHSVLMFGSRRLHDGVARSNVLWNYGHTTVPRHYRDVFVSEYGIAATRGLHDAAVIAALLPLADAAFQGELLERAIAAGKIRADHVLPDDAARNTPAALRAVFGDPDVARHFPPYPLGSDLTSVERELAAALERLKHRTARRWRRIRTVAGSMLQKPAPDTHAALQRLGLDRPRTLREHLLRRLVARALADRR
ncbi:MAG TPA: acetyl-CoA hydrolase/transferase C-terminal domain-containing protein [Woeseiaceae bacterium]